MATMTEIDKVMKHAKRIASGKDTAVKPGQPARFTEACQAGDGIWQGDLCLVVGNGSVPRGYVRVDNPTDSDRQLVPGNTQGAKHCLDSLVGVELYRPKDWSEESLEGPYLRLSQDRTVLHPTHGAVTIPAAMDIACHYQREWNREQAKERRARD